MTIRMTHPELEGQVYDAQPSQVPHLREAGWVPIEGQEQGEVWPAEAQRFEGQERVKIRHPETGGETVVAASAVPYHRERGWQIVEEPEVEPAGTEGPAGRQRGSKGRSRASNEPSDAGAAGPAAKEE